MNGLNKMLENKQDELNLLETIKIKKCNDEEIELSDDDDSYGYKKDIYHN